MTQEMNSYRELLKSPTSLSHTHRNAHTQTNYSYFLADMQWRREWIISFCYKALQPNDLPILLIINLIDEIPSPITEANCFSHINITPTLPSKCRCGYWCLHKMVPLYFCVRFSVDGSCKVWGGARTEVCVKCNQPRWQTHTDTGQVPEV